MVAPQSTQPIFWQWFPVMAPSGEDAGGNGEEEEEEEEGKEGWRMWMFKGGTGEGRGGEWGDLKGMTDLLGLGWNVSLFLISCSILRSSRRDVEDVRTPVTDEQTWGHSQTWWMESLHWLNGYSTMEEKRQRTLHYWGTNALTKWAFCHGVIFVPKYSVSSGLMLVLITTKNSISSRHE